MNQASRKVRRTYLTLMLFNTLAASLIWGINTLFLLDAGLSNTEAFAANAFFTAGFVVFEIPTGVIADLRGRRLSGKVWVNECREVSDNLFKRTASGRDRTPGSSMAVRICG